MLTALARGAEQVFGFDLNPRFIEAANNIAANYKLNVCKWPEDKARFATRRFNPGDVFPVSAQMYSSLMPLSTGG